jgi:hypothetical protein
MRLCAVAPRTIEVKLNLNFAFKVSFNCDAVNLRKCDYGLIQKTLSIANPFLVNTNHLLSTKLIAPKATLSQKGKNQQQVDRHGTDNSTPNQRKECLPQATPTAPQP